MRQFLYAFCVAIIVLASTPASAEALQSSHRAFPPDNCSAGSPFMAFTGVDGSNTFCNSGQDVLTNAIPTCTNGQIVAYEGSKFICKDAANNVPTCTAGSFLTFDGSNYQCKSTGVATCGDNQVLTFNGTSYYCVNKDATIPVCSANQFLTYNGSYQCASVQTPAALNVTCPSGQVLSGFSNGAAVCTDIPGNASCELDHYTFAGGNVLGFRHKNGYLGGLFVSQGYPNAHLVSTEMIPNGTEFYSPDNLHVVNGCMADTMCYTCINGSWTGGGDYSPQFVPSPYYGGS